MCPPAVAPLVDMNEFCTNEELFMFMLCLAHGHSVPANVMTDVNPFNRRPETLPENMWYFVNSTENKGTEGGFWKPRGEPREIFGDASINGWEATHEFYEGQGPHVGKSNWFMLEYRITPKVSREAVLAKDANSLCKVFHHSSSPLFDNEMLQNVAGTEFHRESYSLPPDDFNIPTEQFVTNQMQVDPTSGNIMQFATSLLPNHPVENLPESDYFAPGGYLELLDFASPLSLSSRSDISSCLTTLSDECIDFLDGMLELEVESGGHVEHKDAGCNLRVSDPSIPDNIVVQAAILGLPIEEKFSENARDGKAVNMDSSPPLTLGSQSSGLSNISQTPSADGRSKTDGSLKELKRKYLPSSSPWSCDGSSSSRAPSPSPDRSTRTDGTLKKLQKKYLCFMPF